jgi:hypothetical protein
VTNGMADIMPDVGRGRPPRTHMPLSVKIATAYVSSIQVPFHGQASTLAQVQLDQRSGDIDPERWFPCAHREGARDILYPSTANTFPGRSRHGANVDKSASE